MKRQISLIKIIWLLVTACLIAGCASHPEKLASVEQALIAGNYAEADTLLGQMSDLKNGKDRVLYYFHAGLVAHLVGDYERSNRLFDAADQRIEELYTKSVSAEVGSFLTNDLVKAYPGEDFEKVLIHYYMALNYIMLGDLEGALVECRRVNLKLEEMNHRYEDNKNVYQADAFIHYLMGLIYEAAGDLNNAFIAYRNAVEVYENDYLTYYGIGVPDQLKDDLLRTAEVMGASTVVSQYSEKWQLPNWTKPEIFRTNGRLVLIWDNGLAPFKAEDSLEIPFDDYYLRIAFPYYVARPSATSTVRMQAHERAARSFIVEDVTRIAIKNLDDRQARVIAKTAARGVAKYALKEKVEDEWGEAAGCIVNIFNAATEQADTRSWVTLPDNIQIASLYQRSGLYNVDLTFYDHHNRVSYTDYFPDVVIRPNRTTFLTYRSF